MKVELRSLVTLCDEICLSYNRGASSAEIIDTSKVVLSCPDGIELPALENLGIEVFDDIDPSNSNKKTISKIETCGLRLYHIIRKIYTEDAVGIIDLCKLRLLALRCVQLSFISSYPDYISLIKRNEYNSDAVAHPVVCRSVVEIMRGYSKTAKKIVGNQVPRESIAMTKFLQEIKETERKILQTCLNFVESMISPIEAIGIVYKLWGNTATADSFAVDFFEASLISTHLDLLRLGANISPEVSQLILNRWRTAAITLAHSQPPLQFETTNILRRIVRNLNEKQMRHNDTIKRLLSINIQIYSQCREKGALFCAKELSNEATDFIEYAKLLVYENGTTEIQDIIIKLEHIMQQFVNSNHEKSIFRNIRLNILLLQFSVYVKTSSISNSSLKEFENIINFTKESYQNSSDTIKAYQIICEVLIQLFERVTEQEEIISSYFLKLEELVSIKEDLSEYSQRIIFEWKLKFFITYEKNFKYSQESTTRGQLLQLLIGSGRYISMNNLLCLIQTQIFHCKQSIANKNYIQSRISLEFALEELNRVEQNDDKRLQRLKVKILFSLAHIIGTNLVNKTINTTSQHKLINQAIMYTIESRKLAEELDISLIIENSFILQTKLYLIKLFRLDSVEPESENSSGVLFDLTEDATEPYKFFLLITQYLEFYEIQPANVKYKEYLQHFLLKHNSPNPSIIKAIFLLRLRLQVTYGLKSKFQNAITSGKALESIRNYSEEEMEKFLLQFIKLFNGICMQPTFSLDTVDKLLQDNLLNETTDFFINEVDLNLNLYWNSIISISKLEQQYEVDYSSLRHSHNVCTTHPELMKILALRSTVYLSIISERLKCKCSVVEESDLHGEKQNILVSSRVILQAFKSILHMIVIDTVSTWTGSIVFSSKALSKENLRALSIFKELNCLYERHSCPSCSAAHQYKELKQIEAGIELISTLMQSESTQNLQRFDTLTLARKLLSKTNLNVDFLFQIGTVCQIYEAYEATIEIYKCAFQLEALREHKSYDQVARIIKSLLHCNLSEQEEVQYISQYFQLLPENHNDIKEVVIDSEYLASYLWNIGVKQQQRKDSNWKETLKNAIGHFNYLASYSTALKEKAEELETTLKMFLKKEEAKEQN